MRENWPASSGHQTLKVKRGQEAREALTEKLCLNSEGLTHFHASTWKNRYAKSSRTAHHYGNYRLASLRAQQVRTHPALPALSSCCSSALFLTLGPTWLCTPQPDASEPANVPECASTSTHATERQTSAAVVSVTYMWTSECANLCYELVTCCSEDDTAECRVLSLLQRRCFN